MENKNKLRVGICGYGNLGKGVELALSETDDMEAVVIFTRRDPRSIKNISNIPIVSTEDAKKWIEKLDVVLMCGGSAKDLPEQMPEFAKMFNTVNTFDTHADIPKMFDEVDAISKEAGKISVISIGWDPGIFSHIRKMGDAMLMNAKYYTFWGPGVSQGHSDAIRKITGVKNAIQYTIPIEETMELVRTGNVGELTATMMHKRECYVSANEEDYARIEHEIKTMPKYFEGYETIVHFISEEEIKQRQSKMYHEGWVIVVGTTSNANKQVMEFHLKLDSNPEFTASVAVAYARAAVKLNQKGESGARTITQICVDDIATNEQNATFQYI